MAWDFPVFFPRCLLLCLWWCWWCCSGLVGLCLCFSCAHRCSLLPPNPGTSYPGPTLANPLDSGTRTPGPPEPWTVDPGLHRFCKTRGSRDRGPWGAETRGGRDQAKNEFSSSIACCGGCGAAGGNQPRPMAGAVPKLGPSGCCPLVANTGSSAGGRVGCSVPVQKRRCVFWVALSTLGGVRWQGNCAAWLGLWALAAGAGELVLFCFLPSPVAPPLPLPTAQACPHTGPQCVATTRREVPCIPDPPSALASPRLACLASQQQLHPWLRLDVLTTLT